MFDTELWLKKSREHKHEFFQKFPQDFGFAIDGPNDIAKWVESEPRILFVLKETYGGMNQEFMCMNSIEYNRGDNPTGFLSDKTNLAVSRLAAGIMKLCEGDEAKPSLSYSKNELSEAYKSISTIELKKSTNNRSKSCSDKELKDRALYSKYFVKWQIEYLAPDIVFCCGKQVEDLVCKYILDASLRARIDIFSSNHPSAPGYKVDDTIKRVSEKLKSK